jgi:hypothetical protein
MALIDIVVFLAGGALVWFCKDKLLAWYKGTEHFAQDLKAKAATLEAKAAAAKAAVSK